MGRPEKYVALTEHLQKRAKEFRDSGENKVRMSFKDIEGLGFRLPPSARNHRAWWANNQGTGLNVWDRDPVDKPWQRANFETEDVDMEEGFVTFRYRGRFSQEGLARQAEARARQEEEIRASHVRFRQILKQRKPAEDEKATPASSHRGPSYHQLYGALKGHIRLVAGTDLTKPANPYKDHSKP